MSEFNFKSRKNLVTVKIEGREYSFDISPTNYQFVKNVSSMAREVEDLSAKIGAMTEPNWGKIAEAFELIEQKQRAVIDNLLPGAWDELYAASGEDMEGMTELIVYIGREIQEGFAKAKIKAVEPVAPSGEAV